MSCELISTGPETVGGDVIHADCEDLLAECGEDDLAALFFPTCLVWPDGAEVEAAVSVVMGGLPRVFWAMRSKSSLDNPWLTGIPTASRVLIILSEDH